MVYLQYKINRNQIFLIRYKLTNKPVVFLNIFHTVSVIILPDNHSDNSNVQKKRSSNWLEGTRSALVRGQGVRE